MARKRRDSAAARGKSLERRIAEQERELTGQMAEKRRARRAAKDVYSAIGYDLLSRDGIAQVEEGLFSQTLAFDDISYQLLASIYFSPFSPTYFYHSSQCDFADRANALSPLLASCRQPPCRRPPARCP